MPGQRSDRIVLGKVQEFVAVAIGAQVKGTALYPLYETRPKSRVFYSQIGMVTLRDVSWRLEACIIPRPNLYLGYMIFRHYREVQTQWQRIAAGKAPSCSCWTTFHRPCFPRIFQVRMVRDESYLPLDNRARTSMPNLVTNSFLVSCRLFRRLTFGFSLLRC